MYDRRNFVVDKRVFFRKIYFDPGCTDPVLDQVIGKENYMYYVSIAQFGGPFVENVTDNDAEGKESQAGVCGSPCQEALERRKNCS